MKRENEFAVGVVVIATFAVVVAGALWLSGAHLGKAEAVYTARFRTVGGLSGCAILRVSVTNNSWSTWTLTAPTPSSHNRSRSRRAWSCLAPALVS